MGGFRAQTPPDDIEALLVMVLSHRGPDALRGAIEDIRERAKVTPPEDAKELVTLAARLNAALVAVEHGIECHGRAKEYAI